MSGSTPTQTTPSAQCIAALIGWIVVTIAGAVFVVNHMDTYALACGAIIVPIWGAVTTYCHGTMLAGVINYFQGKLS
jgi:hypothetical protein